MANEETDYAFTGAEHAYLAGLSAEQQALASKIQGALALLATQKGFDLTKPISFNPISGTLKGTLKHD